MSILKGSVHHPGDITNGLRSERLASSRAGLMEFPIELTKVIGSDFGELQFPNPR